MPSLELRRRYPSQERAQQTVEAILQAAAEVFEDRGFEGGTIERIVERAGVSVGSLYQYFPTKRALLVALAERICRDGQQVLLDLLKALSANPPLDQALRQLVDSMVALHESQPRLRCLLFEEAALPGSMREEMGAFHDRVRAGLSGYLDRQGISDPDIRARVLHQAVSTLVHELVLHPQPGLPPDRAAEEVLRLARGYLAPLAPAS